MEKSIKYQNLVCVIPSGSAANAMQEFDIALDRGYNKITGIMVNVLLSSTLNNNLLVGGRTDRELGIPDQIPIAGWNGNDQAGVAPDDKFISMNVGYGSGETYYAQLTPLASPGADVTVYVTLRLEADLTELPK